jgi:omega-6 fatty acid desaturase (delta-12 desaturase)
LNIAALVVIPALYSHVAIGFAVFQQHTHESVRWYNDPTQWEAFRVQLESTLHLSVPWYLALVFANGDVHTAHHLDTRIPMYRLRAAQRYLETIHPTRVRHVRFTFRSYLKTVRSCQLYDYDRHVWMDFKGNDTAVP